MIAAVIPHRPNLANLAFYLVSGIVCACVATLVTWHLLAPGPQLEPPDELIASKGESADHVELSWSAVETALEYRIYRDGEFIAAVETTVFFDEEADVGGLPAAPELAGSDDRVDGVMLRWTEPAVPAGATHIYQVRAVNADVRSERSVPALGHRAADPIVDYELEIRGGDWTSVGPETSHLDAGADEIGLHRLRIAASQGDHDDYVRLELVDSFPGHGPVSTYRVRALNGAGPGAPSERTGGQRVVVQPAWYQWQRSAGYNDADFEDLPGGHTPQSYDTEVTPGHIHHYRLLVGFSDMQPVTTDGTIGFRASNDAFVGDPSLEPTQFCKDFLGTSRCWCRSDDDHGVHLCGDAHTYWTDDGHTSAYLIVSEGDSQRALPIVDFATYEDGDTHGADTRRLIGFEVVDASAGLLHLELVSSFHSFESMAPERFEHRTETTIRAIVDLNGPSPRLLAIADRRHRYRSLDTEGVRDLMASARWPENLGDERYMDTAFDREIRIEDGGSALFIDNRRFELGGAPIFFPLRGDDDDHLSDAFIAP